jgi:hypothetical protein
LTEAAAGAQGPSPAEGRGAEKHGRGAGGPGAREATAGPLPGIVFATLVLACFAAFFLTQRLKHTPTAVQMFKLTPFFSPYPRGHTKQEAISFRLAGADRVTVTVIDAGGNAVATLLRSHLLERYKPVSLRWNGRLGVARGYSTQTSSSGRTTILVARNTGPLAKPGEYRVRVTRSGGRSVDSPKSFRLVGP